jgi:crotonobetainyl-CoA:carnitine CoA-transferase CaiB-like acyl-CoA transferase
LGLLERFRVIESAVLFNGDFVGMMLGDLGADVIKVESPFQGDYVRDMIGQITPHHSPAHLQINRNKRSVTLNLRTDAGREAFWRLHKTADVFVDGNVADTCNRLGVGYAEQKARNPGIVYCQVTGFGMGPYGVIPTHGEMMNSLAGARPQEMHSDGLAWPKENEDLLGGTSTGARGSVAAGLFGVQYVLAALLRRNTTGEGCYIDVSGADAVIASAWQGAVYTLNKERITDFRNMPTGAAKGHNASPKYAWYQTKDDKFVELCAIEPKFWRNFCMLVGREDLLQEGSESDKAVDFSAGSQETRHQVQEIFSTKTQAEWMQAAVTNDVPIAPAFTSLNEAVVDPHMSGREIFHEGSHPETGDFTYVGRAALIEGDPFVIRHPAPSLGQHTDGILAELGYSPEEIAALHDSEAV